MNYYRFTASTPYAGTDNVSYLMTLEPLTEKEIDEYCAEYAQEVAELYEYIVENEVDESEFEDEETGEIDYDAYEEELSTMLHWYYEDCECECEEITEEEYYEESGE